MTKETRIYNGENTISNKWCGENWSTPCKRKKLEWFVTPYTKINSKWKTGASVAEMELLLAAVGFLSVSMGG